MPTDRVPPTTSAKSDPQIWCCASKAWVRTGKRNVDRERALMVLPQVCEQEEPPGAVTLWHRFAALDTASPKIWMDALFGCLRQDTYP